MMPTRHALAALLTEQKRYTEALDVYQTDLKRHPKNIWALHGISMCLKGLKDSGSNTDETEIKNLIEDVDAIEERIEIIELTQ